MGINLDIYVHKKDLYDLLEDPADFAFLLRKTIMRYHQFTDLFDIDELMHQDGISSQTLLAHIAKYNLKIPNRETWVEILNSYDLIFLPDSKSLPQSIRSQYFEIYSLYSSMVSYIEEHFEDYIKKYKDFDQCFEEIRSEKKQEEKN